MEIEVKIKYKNKFESCFLLFALNDQSHTWLFKLGDGWCVEGFDALISRFLKFNYWWLDKI